jgi:hypothetical protein
MSCFQYASEYREVAGCRVSADAASPLAHAGTIQQIISEFFAQINSHFAKGAFAIDKSIEVVVGAFPFVVFVPTMLFEVFEKVFVLLVTVNESEFATDDRFLPAASYHFCVIENLVIVFLLHSVFGLFIYIEPKEFPTSEFHSARIANRGPEIEV